MKQELTAIKGLKKMNIQRLKEMRQFEIKKMDHRDKGSNKKENKNQQRNKGYQNNSIKEIRNKDNTGKQTNQKKKI